MIDQLILTLLKSCVAHLELIDIHPYFVLLFKNFAYLLIKLTAQRLEMRIGIVKSILYARVDLSVLF